MVTVVTSKIRNVKTEQDRAEDWFLDRICREGIHPEVTVLTPEKAALLLGKNEDNRALTRTRVDVYAADIAEGRWQFNGEPIIVSESGELNDGQHRCAAVVQAGKPITTLIVFGVDRESRKTTDQGKSKSAGDYAGMDGIKNANIVAAIARMTVSYDETGDIKAASYFSNSRVLEYVEANADELGVSAGFAAGHSKKLHQIISVSPFGFAFHVCRRINDAAAEEYFGQIATGEGLVSTDPAYVVRNRLLALGKAPRNMKTEILLHGWNAFRRGEKRSLVRANGALPPLI